jgi:hypothetical protein
LGQSSIPLVIAVPQRRQIVSVVINSRLVGA